MRRSSSSRVSPHFSPGGVIVAQDFPLQGVLVTEGRSRNYVQESIYALKRKRQALFDVVLSVLGRVEGRRACLRSRESLLPAAFATRRCLNPAPSRVSSPPLVKPDVPFSGIRLSVGDHAFAHGKLFVLVTRRVRPYCCHSLSSGKRTVPPDLTLCLRQSHCRSRRTAWRSIAR